jgi:hypothetical protein
MPRSDPTLSPYCATRHLLRHLRDARELRRNPLAREAFAARDDDAALRAVTERVHRALRAMDARQHLARTWQGARQAAILLRVDVERHDPRLVAANLGLSTRQFHRERRLAHDRFLDAYRAETPIRAATVDDQFAKRLLERAASLADSGEISSASAIFDDIARSGADVALRCEALGRIAEIDAWAHQLDRAGAYLRAADALLAGANLDAERGDGLRDANDAVALSLRWFVRGPEAVGHALPAGGARATLVRAAAALRSGESGYASHLLRQLDAAAPALQSPDAVVDLLTLQGELSDFNAESPQLSEELFARAAGIAHAHGLHGRELYATHQLCLTRWMHSRDPRDRAAYRRLVDSTDRALPARLRSYLAFSAADVELAIGHPGRALASARAAAAVSTNRFERFSAQGLAAGALLRLGRIADAGAQAALAADAARAEGHPRVLSLAQRISAQAQLAQGNRRAARAAIDEAIEIARYFSSPHVLTQALAVRAKLSAR